MSLLKCTPCLLLLAAITMITSCYRPEKVTIIAEFAPGCGNTSGSVAVITKRLQALNKNNTVSLLDDGRMSIRLSPAADTLLLPRLLSEKGHVYVAETTDNHIIFPILLRIDEMLKAEYNAAHGGGTYPENEHPLLHLLIPNLDNNGNILPGCRVGSAQVCDTLIINELLARPYFRELLPQNIVLLWTNNPQYGSSALDLVAVKTGKYFDLGPATVKHTLAHYDDRGFPEVSIELIEGYHKEWEQLTHDNIGKELAIACDGSILLYPRVQSEIAGGTMTISGKFTDEYIRTLAAIIEGGTLECPVNWK